MRIWSAAAVTLTTKATQDNDLQDKQAAGTSFSAPGMPDVSIWDFPRPANGSHWSAAEIPKRSFLLLAWLKYKLTCHPAVLEGSNNIRHSLKSGAAVTHFTRFMTFWKFKSMILHVCVCLPCPSCPAGRRESRGWRRWRGTMRRSCRRWSWLAAPSGCR